VGNEAKLKRTLII